MKPLSFIQILFVGILVVVVIVFMTNKLVNDHIVPSLDEFIASTTPKIVNKIDKIDFATTTTLAQLALNNPKYKVMDVIAPKGTIHSLIASTSEQMTTGLSYRDSIAGDTGMTFFFAKSDIYGFWMKDMSFPIDIVWIDENKKVVGIEPDLKVESYPESVLPKVPVRYVLELNSGGAQYFGIATGTILRFK